MLAPKSSFRVRPGTFTVSQFPSHMEIWGENPHGVGRAQPGLVVKAGEVRKRIPCGIRALISLGKEDSCSSSKPGEGPFPPRWDLPFGVISLFFPSFQCLYLLCQPLKFEVQGGSGAAWGRDISTLHTPFQRAKQGKNNNKRGGGGQREGERGVPSKEGWGEVFFLPAPSRPALRSLQTRRSSESLRCHWRRLFPRSS